MSALTDAGGPAFPTDEYYNERRYACTPGMTLRDYFAAQALTAYWCDPHDMAAPHDRSVTDAAAFAYRQADALIAQRKGVPR